MALTRSIGKSNAVDNEGSWTALRIAELKENPVRGNFDAEHLKEINRRILQDIPTYHGGIYRMSTGEHVRSRSINNGQDSYVVHYKHGGVTNQNINDAIQQIGPIKALGQLPKDEFNKRISKLYGDLDHIHAFNEANSRTLRIFTEQIAKEAGHKLDWTKTDQNQNARDTLYKARDLEVSKRSFPNLTIEFMRNASNSQYEAYDTQKKLGTTKTLEQIFKENLIHEKDLKLSVSPYQAGKAAAQADVVKAETRVVYSVSSYSTKRRDFTDPILAATAFLNIPGSERPTIIRKENSHASYIGQTSQVGIGENAKYGKHIGESDPILKNAYNAVLIEKAKTEAMKLHPNDIHAQNIAKREIAQNLGMAKETIRKHEISIKNTNVLARGQK